MILGRNYLNLLFDTDSQKFFKADLVRVGWKKLSLFSYIFFNFVFKRLKHFVNFWFWWYFIQQLLVKICNFLHTNSKEIFRLLHVFAAKFLIFSLTFFETFHGLQGVGCKTGVGSFGIGSPKM